MAYVHWLRYRAWLANEQPDKDDAAYVIVGRR